MIAAILDEMIAFLSENIRMLVQIILLILFTWLFLYLVGVVARRWKAKIVASKIEGERLSRFLTMENVVITTFRATILVVATLILLGLLGFNISPADRQRWNRRPGDLPWCANRNQGFHLGFLNPYREPVWGRRRSKDWYRLWDCREYHFAVCDSAGSRRKPEYCPQWRHPDRRKSLARLEPGESGIHVAVRLGSGRSHQSVGSSREISRKR